MRVHHLSVRLRSQRSRLQQRQLVIHTSPVHIPSSINVIQRIQHSIQSLEEAIAEDLLRVLSHPFGQRLDLHVRIEFRHRLSCTLGFLTANILPSEEELPIEIGDLDLVHVGDLQLAFSLGAAPNAHHCHVLEQLAADGTRSNYEPLLLHEFLLIGPSKHGGLSVVAAIPRLAVFFGEFGSVEGGVVTGEGLDAVDVEPLALRSGVMSDGFHGFLGGDSADERGDWLEITRGLKMKSKMEDSKIVS